MVFPLAEVAQPTNPSAATLRPRWRVECGAECEVGITVDDHCFIVLLKREHEWMPTPYIPREAAEWMASHLDGLD